MNQPNRTSLPVLAFTMGDPGGIGPEVTLRAIDYFSSAYPFIPVLFGSRSLLEHPFTSRNEALRDQFQGLDRTGFGG